MRKSTNHVKADMCEFIGMLFIPFIFNYDLFVQPLILHSGEVCFMSLTRKTRGYFHVNLKI